MKRLSEQTLVITGASSGIGLATAYEAAARGARTVLVARNRAALDRVAAVIRGKGGHALPVVADVAERDQLRAAADAAIREYGGFDTWVNNAAVGTFGTLAEVTEADHRRVFDVNYWGLVHGSLIAAGHLRAKKGGDGGAIVNLGSVLSDVSFPLQGPYSATKAAVRAFTDALRIELEHERAPVCVTLIKPAAIATPFAQHARNYMDREPSLPPPVYAPEDVAAAILHAAEHGGRDLYVGGSGKAITLAGNTVPAALDWASARFGPAASKRLRAPTSPTEGNLYTPGRDGDVRGSTPYPVLRSGVPPSGVAPLLAGAALLVAGTAAALLGRKG